MGPPFHRNFGRLILVCIDASDSENRRIFEAFFELYKICIPSHRSKFRNFANFCVWDLVDLDKFFEMRLLSLSEASIQPRTSFPKFL